MHNDLFTIGKFTVHGYGLMIAIGFIAAYLVAEYRAGKKGVDKEKIFPIALIAIVMGLVCAKVLFWITILDEIIEDPGIMLNIGDGFVVYGGIIGGFIFCFLYCKIKKLDFLKYVDIIFPSVALGQGFGRIGCFLAGCCYGTEADTLISIVFKDSAFAPNGIALIPTQLISSGLNFANFAFLVWFSGKSKVDGRTSAMYLIFYSIGRFIIEFFRGDLGRGSVGALSTSQFISLFILIVGIVIFVVAPKLNEKKK